MHKIIFTDGNNTEEVYIEAATYNLAISIFREQYPDRSRYKIMEVCVDLFIPTASATSSNVNPNASLFDFNKVPTSIIVTSCTVLKHYI